MPPLTSRAAAVALFALLAGCDEPKPRPPPSDEGAPEFLKTPAPAPAAAEAPAAPAWAKDLMGKTLAAAFPDQGGACIGNTDGVSARYRQAVRIEGWAWDPAAKAPVSRVLLAGQGGRIVGAGETGVPRPDVPAARKEVTAQDTGWQGIAGQTAGRVEGWGLVNGGRTLCRLGFVALG